MQFYKILHYAKACLEIMLYYYLRNKSWLKVHLWAFSDSFSHILPHLISHGTNQEHNAVSQSELASDLHMFQVQDAQS